MNLLEFGLCHSQDRNLFSKGIARIILWGYRKWADEEEQKLRESGADLKSRDLNRMKRYIEWQEYRKRRQ